MRNRSVAVQDDSSSDFRAVHTLRQDDGTLNIGVEPVDIHTLAVIDRLDVEVDRRSKERISLLASRCLKRLLVGWRRAAKLDAELDVGQQLRIA
ncbi:hypothetical protein D3C71_1311680 [compost metagenome]